MKRNILEFTHRGFIACGFGPLVLAVIYLVLHRQGAVDTLAVNEVCTGIFSISALAFIVGGMNIIYQNEKLPLMAAISIHGAVLYASYLITYLINGWLQRGMTPILVFTAIFVLGYIVIWAVIYFITKRNTARLNEKLMQKQQDDRAH